MPYITLKHISIFIKQMNVAVLNISMYFFKHPQVTQHIDMAYATLKQMLNAQPKVTLLLVHDKLVYNGNPLKIDNLLSHQFIHNMLEKGIEHISFYAGLSRKELEDFLIALSATKEISMLSSRSLTIGKIKVNKAIDQSGKKDEPESEWDLKNQNSDVFYHSHIKEIKEAFDSIKYNDEVNITKLSLIAGAIATLIHSDKEPIKMLAAIREMDEYTFTHVVNVSILTISLAKSLGFTGHHLHEIGIATYLHDVGKIFLPDGILNKPGTLTAEERKITEKHPIKGAMRIMKLKGIPKIAILAAMEHHVKYDGTGYPKIKGEYTPNIVSQMISITDTYDALRSSRVYQEAKSTEFANNILISEKGKSFNPLLVDKFIQLIT